MREVHGHEGSTLNNTLRILGEERDPSGGAHQYVVRWGGEAGIPAAEQWIDFQCGPLQEAGPNGITDEALLAIVADRLDGFQQGPFQHDQNGVALAFILRALDALKTRTRERQERGVEGMHQV